MPQPENTVEEIYISVVVAVMLVWSIGLAAFATCGVSSLVGLYSRTTVIIAFSFWTVVLTGLTLWWNPYKVFRLGRSRS